MFEPHQADCTSSLSALVTQAASPTLHLRWNGDALQQMWTVTQYQGATPSAVVTEWRDVPRIAAPIA